MDMVYVWDMENFILRLWIDGEIEDYPIIDRIAKERGLTDYVKRVRDSHDEFIKELMNQESYEKRVYPGGRDEKI